MGGWQFPIFSLASSFVHFVTIALPFGEPVGPHCLHPFLLHISFPMSVFPHAQHHYSPPSLSNAHTRDSGRERDRERENPSFFERKLLKPQRNKESSPRANSSGFSLLKCKGEKRCCWEPPLFQNAAALQHRRDVMGSWENLVPWCPHVPWLWLGQQVAFI